MRAQRTSEELLAAGWDALRAGDWAAARSCFESALARDETPEACEGLGWAGYYLDDDALNFDARERAYRLFRRRGDDSSAARVAAWLAADCLEFRGEPSVANGWLQRAHGLLDAIEPNPDHGWLAVHEASMVLDEDPVGARRLAVQAADLGRRFGVPELEMLGLALEGRARVSEGDLVGGMQRLDEATAVALSGEADLLVCVAWACCYLINACEQVSDHERASEWCQRVVTYCDQHGIALLLGLCRAEYAGVLTWQGRWDAAEAELRSASERLETSRPPLVGHALVRLAELYCRQGRLEDAATLLARCDGHPRALLVRAELALHAARPDDAGELAERFLRRYPWPGRIERCPGLEVAVRAYLELGEIERADGALVELRDVATRVGTRPLRAAALTSQARLEATRGDREGARRCFEDALDLLAATGAPFETARVRLDLAAVLGELGRTDAARREVDAALAVFRQLGAAGEIARAGELLKWLGRVPARSGEELDEPLCRLTRRERDVLVLVAEGLTNRDIAERLVVSEHTVHRHMTSILRKLALPSRAAAASLAGRHGLV
jgi:LuxR family transcriptional regulator, maltose regulon positive regulatory protein